MAGYEEEQRLWHASEHRYLPRLVRLAFRLIDVPTWVRGIKHLSTRSEESAEGFIRDGINEWVEEGRLSADEGEEALEQLSTPAVVYAMLHMGAHFAISIPLRFPFGALARFVYTCVLRVQAEISALLRRASASDARQTHTIVVALVALLPGFGRLAYLFAQPLRSNNLLFLVPLDGAAKKLPGHGYDRLHVRPLVDWWALPVNAAERARRTALRSLSAGGMLRGLRDHLPLIAVVAAANAALFGMPLYGAAPSHADWWSGERGLLHTGGFLQMCAAALAGVLAYRAFWHGAATSAADAAGIFLWPLTSMWLLLFALDDFLEIHDTIGDFIADHLTRGVNLTDGPVMIGYACIAGGLLYLFRHEVLTSRGSSVLLIAAVAVSAAIAVATVADEAWVPVHDSLTAPTLSAGFWLAAMTARLIEVRRPAGTTEDARAGRPV
jgi:hypothetical protein